MPNRGARKRRELVQAKMPPRATVRRTSHDWSDEEKAHKKHRKALRKQIFNRIPPDKRLCGAKLATGRPCKQGKYVVEWIEEGKKPRYFLAPTCFAHLPKPLLAKLNKKGVGPMSPGRPPRPRIIDVMKEQIELEIAEWLAPYREGLEAMKQVVVGNGAHARMVEVPDHRTRMLAAEALVDRVYGKPKQTTDVNAQVHTEPVEVPTTEARQQEVARILAESGALGMVAAKHNPASQN